MPKARRLLTRFGKVLCSSRLAIETFKCFNCGSFFCFRGNYTIAIYSSSVSRLQAHFASKSASSAEMMNWNLPRFSFHIIIIIIITLGTFQRVLCSIWRSLRLRLKVEITLKYFLGALTRSGLCRSGFIIMNTTPCLSYKLRRTSVALTKMCWDDQRVSSS